MQEKLKLLGAFTPLSWTVWDHSIVDVQNNKRTYGSYSDVVNQSIDWISCYVGNCFTFL